MWTTAAMIQAGLVSSNVVPVGRSGQDSGRGAGVGARIWAHRHQLGVINTQHYKEFYISLKKSTADQYQYHN